jgi:hypothetical protein
MSGADTFWDPQQPPPQYYQERGTAVDSVTYTEIPRDQLSSAIRNQRRGLLWKGVARWHDNVHPPTAVHTAGSLRWSTLHIPDWAPSVTCFRNDYAIFRWPISEKGGTWVACNRLIWGFGRDYEEFHLRGCGVVWVLLEQDHITSM